MMILLWDFIWQRKWVVFIPNRAGKKALHFTTSFMDYSNYFIAYSYLQITQSYLKLNTTQHSINKARLMLDTQVCIALS